MSSRSPENILLFTGKSGAGKSTIAAEICRSRTGKHLAERAMSRTIAAEENFSRSRHWVEAVGLNAAIRALRERTLDEIQSCDETLIAIDGAYDSELPKQISKHHPDTAVGIIGVEAPYETRLQRYAQRLGITPSEAVADIHYLDKIKTDTGMGELTSQVDLWVVNTGEIDDAYSAVHDWLDSLEKQEV